MGVLVSQFRDVSPGDWYYEDLRLLVEVAGSTAGFPDGTFRTNMTATRAEVVAILNVSLQQLEKLIAASLDDCTAIIVP